MSIHAVAGGPEWMPQGVAAGAIAVLFVLAWLGADAASRFQTIVMVVLVSALVSIYEETEDWLSLYRLLEQHAPGGSIGTAAIYTEASELTHIIRRVMIRMESWLNFVVPV